MNDAVPCKSRIVHNDMDLAVAKIRRLLDQRLDVFIVQDVADHGQCASCASVGGIDVVGCCGSLSCFALLVGGFSMGAMNAILGSCVYV